MFDGKMREFREEGGVVKTEEEKRQMAEKRRFKQNREFKERLDEEQENADADIRSFKFRSLEKKESSRDFRREEKKSFSKNERDDRKPFRKNDRDDRKPFRKNDRDDRRPFRKSDRDRKNFKKNNQRFQDDDED